MAGLPLRREGVHYPEFNGQGPAGLAGVFPGADFGQVASRCELQASSFELRVGEKWNKSYKLPGFIAKSIFTRLW